MVNPELQLIKQRFGIVGNNEKLIRAIEIAVQVARTDLSVLVTGESGVGKESFPKIIHQNSRRKHGKYIAVNCGAIPEGTIDSELFGHVKGAYTGAIDERDGYFGEANGGTIFLDEVGELPMATQARLLRVLESGEYMKVGSSKVQKTDVRVVAATNVNMLQAIADRRFREDLYYRLCAVPIMVPDLRERGEDIFLLFRKFAVDFAEKYQMPPIQLTDDARKMLIAYSWPGNIRQLKNVTEQISIIEEKREIDNVILSKYLPREHVSLPSAPVSASGVMSTENERKMFAAMLEMRNEMEELKRELKKLKEGHVEMHPATTAVVAATPALFESVPGTVVNTTPARTSDVTIVATPATRTSHTDDDDIEDTEEVIEEDYSLKKVEKDKIIEALKRHHGKRRKAAQELNISERTLYRKIKEYGLA